MDVMVFDPTDDIELLRPLLEEWQAQANPAPFGIELDVDVTLRTAAQLVAASHTDLLVVVDKEGRVAGLLGLVLIQNHVGPGLFAHERLFYVSRSARGAGSRLRRAAEEWQAARGASHLIMTASFLASDEAERAVQFYIGSGFSMFEFTCIKGPSHGV